MTTNKALPSLSLLNELLHYEPQSGTIYWAKSTSRKIKVGSRAGTVNDSGYLKVGFKLNGKTSYFAAHRIIWYMQTGTDPIGQQVDHIDGNRLNNKFCNLRLASNIENSWNRRLSSSNKCGYKGVRWHARDKNWQARIVCCGKRFYLGSFSTAELAHMAYCKAAAELHGEFARGQ